MVQFAGALLPFSSPTAMLEAGKLLLYIQKNKDTRLAHEFTAFRLQNPVLGCRTFGPDAAAPIEVSAAIRTGLET